MVGSNVRSARCLAASFLLACLLLPGTARSNVTFVEAQTRPSDAKAIHIGSGVLLAYDLLADAEPNVVRQRILVRAANGAIRDVTVAPGALVNGATLGCTDASGLSGFSASIVAQYQFCKQLPLPFTPGKSIVTFLSWRPPHIDPRQHLLPIAHETTDEMIITNPGD